MDWIQIAVKLISELEGCRLEAYPDPKFGWKLPTIGFGTTKYPKWGSVKKGDRITLDQAKLFLGYHILNIIEPKLKNIKTWEDMNYNQKAAITSFAYNLGANFYGKPTFKSITNLLDSPNHWTSPEFVKAKFQLYCNPKDLTITAGLKARRLKEAELFLKEI